jgi:hypothetical protein
MVAIERIKLAETEEELKELRMEKDALKRALRLIEGENSSLRQTNALTPASLPDLHASDTPATLGRPRSSSEVAIKSRPSSIVLETDIPVPASPSPETSSTPDPSRSPPSQSTSPTISRSLSLDDSQSTPRMPRVPLSSFSSELDQASPWADVNSPSTSSL